MKIHYHRINERDSERERRQFWHYTRHFWHFYPKNNKNSINFTLEFAFRKHVEWWTVFAWILSIGNKGSETPWDGHISVLGQSIFWSFSRGRRFADFLTSRKRKYTSREIGLRTTERRLDVYIWAIKHEWSRYSKGGGLGFSIPIYISIPDALWGKKYYDYEIVDKYKSHLTFPEGVYPVTMHLQKMTLRRRKRKDKIYSRKWIIEIDSETGIPSHVDHSGGYKGDRTFGFAVDFPFEAVPHHWWGPAANLAAAYILKERGRTGFVKPDPIDEPERAPYYSGDTGTLTANEARDILGLPKKE